jgi:hypothetical protein
MLLDDMSHGDISMRMKADSKSCSARASNFSCPCEGAAAGIPFV